MTFKPGIRCLICRKLTEPSVVESEKEITNAKAYQILHNKLCLAMELELCPKFQEWNFEDEPFPYCPPCHEKVQRLGELVDDLKRIEEEVSGSLSTISALVITSENSIDSSISDPLLITPKMGQAREYFRSRRLQAKHEYFRKLIIRRFDPRVNVEQYDDDDSCNYLDLPDQDFEYELVPNTLIKTEPPTEELSSEFHPADEDTFSEKEFKVERNLNENGEGEPESILGVAENWALLSEVPTLTIVPNGTSEMPGTAFTIANAVTKTPHPHQVEAIDEAAGTYHINGFQFKTLEFGYECSTCSNIYPFAPTGNHRTKWKNVKSHIVHVHLGIRPATDRTRICEECGKEFKSSSNLSEHRARVHRSPKYECGQCGAKFFRPSFLNQHLTKHTGQKPFPCEQCGKSFLRKKTLKNHRKLHDAEARPHECLHCKLNFPTQLALSTHVTRHHEGIKFPCQFCGYGFATKASLNRHIGRAHVQDQEGAVPALEEFGISLGPDFETA